MIRFNFFIAVLAFLFYGFAASAQEGFSAQPVGGQMVFEKYIEDNMQYPEQAKKFSIEGNVFVVFDIDEEGNLTDIMIAKGIGAGCDEEAMRLLNNAPKWKPAMQGGKPVRQRVSIPIRFRLPD
ncbi:energy transducer TonB [Fulvivirga sp. 29W222]|uniref:Energy transducer TonB n=1 Tax=Fulvivirga marina TaxID=2494733 RepID=A0A937G1K4_9BACT|nr:energy transducer TonB [Fulvivirga marina]MBL6448987.1 energy transducer TonB [Fulvivirga marina]